MSGQQKLKLTVKDYIIIGLVIILIGGAILFYLLTRNNEPTETSNNSLKIEDGIANRENADDTEAGIAIPGWNEITIPAEETNVVIDFFNPSENEELYYLSFELILTENNESIYQSDLVKPGEYIKTVKLERELEAGTYDALVFVQPYRISDGQVMNNAEIAVKLNVE